MITVKDFGMGIIPFVSSSVLAFDSKIPSDGTVKTKRVTESVLDSFIYNGDW